MPDVALEHEALDGYRLLGQLGRGPDGVAYLGEDDRGRSVEVLRLRGYGENALRRVELTERIALLSQLRVTGLLPIVAQRLTGPHPYVVIPHRAPFEHELESTDSLSMATVAGWGRTIAKVLAEMHDFGVVHGAVGLACLRARERSSGGLGVSLDGTGLSMGREAGDAYAPELGFSAATSAADVWGLGALLTRLLDRVVETDGTIDTGVEATVAGVIRDACHEEPEARPTAAEVVTRLGPVGESLAPAPDQTGAMPSRLGRYQLLEKLGEGGMGAVYRADDASGGPQVAIKVLLDKRSEDPVSLERFRREARLLSQLDNPNIARFIGAHRHADTEYLVMEYVEGRSLKEVLNADGRVSPERALAIAADLARALADVHDLGAIHRDVKPANVLLVGDGETAKLCDFGIAREAVEEEALTRTGTAPGTPWYMSPEQCKGEDLAAAVDVYALGATLFHMLAGSPPFPHKSSAVAIAAHISDPVPDVRELAPEVDDELAHVVARSLEKDAANRYPDARALLEDLERIRRGDPATVDSLPRAADGAGAPMVWEMSWKLGASPTELWPHVSDTDRLNRAIGLDPVQFDREVIDDGAVHTDGRSKAAGLTLAWREHPFEWVAPSRLGVLREYSTGPLVWMRSTVVLSPARGGTELRHLVEAMPRGALGRAALSYEIGIRARRALGRVYKRIDDFCQRTRARAGDGGVPRLDTPLDGWLLDPFEPAAKLSEVQLSRIEEAGRRLVTDGVPATVADRLCDHLRFATPQEVGHIRPLAFARKHDLDPNAVTEACLRSAHHGALVMLWDVICPACRIPCDIAESLRAVREHGHCDACNIDFDLDLARSVEMIFRAHPRIREADVATYCIGGPAHSPHVIAQLRLGVARRFDLELQLEEGSYQVTGRQMPRAWSFTVHDKAMLSQWDLPLRSGLASDVQRSLAGGQQRLVLTNDLDHEVLVRVERVADRGDALTAAQAACNPVFRQLFPHECLSPGQLVSVSSVTLLVAQLSDVNELYAAGRENDAFSELIRLQRGLDERVATESGAVVKLMGDGFLAAFPDAVSCLRAAFALLDDGDGPQMRVAAHGGPSMMTTINDRLDYFGRTVHAAAALVEAAGAGELLVGESLASDPGAGPLLDGVPSTVSVVDGVVAHRVRPSDGGARRRDSAPPLS